MRVPGFPGWTVVTTLLAAMVLTVVPLPPSLGMLRPAWVLLVLAYWNSAMPRRVGVIMAWLGGLLLDALTGAVLGEHALALVAASFCVLKLNELLRTFPLWQQSVVLLPVFVLYEFVLFWIDGATGRAVDPLWRWAPVITTTLLWPVVNTSLNLFTDWLWSE